MRCALDGGYTAWFSACVGHSAKPFVRAEMRQLAAAARSASEWPCRPASAFGSTQTLGLKVVRRFIALWLVVVFGALVVAQLLFTGASTSEVAGNLAFALLVLCLPSSLAAYPIATVLVGVFEPRGLFPYNDRLVLFLWWLVFVLVGLAQWGAVILFNRWRSSPRSASMRNSP